MVMAEVESEGFSHHAIGGSVVHEILSYRTSSKFGTRKMSTTPSSTETLLASTEQNLYYILQFICTLYNAKAAI